MFILGAEEWNRTHRETGRMSSMMLNDHYNETERQRRETEDNNLFNQVVDTEVTQRMSTTNNTGDQNASNIQTDLSQGNILNPDTTVQNQNTALLEKIKKYEDFILNCGNNLAAEVVNMKSSDDLKSVYSVGVAKSFPEL